MEVFSLKSCPLLDQKVGINSPVIIRMSERERERGMQRRLLRCVGRFGYKKWRRICWVSGRGLYSSDAFMVL